MKTIRQIALCIAFAPAFFSASANAAPLSHLFYGLASYVIPTAYGTNEAKNGKKFFGSERSLFGLGDTNYKINVSQFNSDALNTKSYDQGKLLCSFGVPAVVSACTYAPSWIASKIFSKTPVRIVRGGINGIVSVAVLSQYDAIKKEIYRDPEARKGIKEMRKKWDTFKSELRK